MAREGDNHFREQAAFAQQQADRARSQEDRASWLRIAQGWMSLIRGHSRSAGQKFDDAVASKGTGQDVSKEEQ